MELVKYLSAQWLINMQKYSKAINVLQYYVAINLDQGVTAVLFTR
jgi:hypothetical protein